jgi:hypothetical protein
MAALLQKEEIEWKWSPLFRAMCKLADLPLRYHSLPFQHSPSEL